MRIDKGNSSLQEREANEMITGHLYFADGFTFVLAHAWLLQLQRENYHHFEQKYAFKKSKIGKTCRTRLHEFSRSV